MLSAHFNFAASHITRNVASASRAHAKAMEQISTGYKINVGADGPADLIMSEKLRSQIEGLERAIQNTSESNNILGIMDGALGQVQSIITKMSGLAIEAANTGVVSPDRIAANQAEIDSGLQAIERIMETTSYGGRKLLGNMQDSGVINENYIDMVEVGKLQRENNGRLPDDLELFSREDAPDRLFMIARDQNHAEQISKDGKTLAGEKTFILPPAEEGGEPTELTFAEGSSLGDIVSALRERGLDYLDVAVPQEGDLTPAPTLDDILMNSDAGALGGRSGTDINIVELGAEQLAELAGMGDEDAQSSLADYMNDFTREVALDVDGWDRLSDAEQSLLMTADHFSNLGMDDLAGIRGADGRELTLSDLYGGREASLANNPAAAIELLNKARKNVTAERAQIAATQSMNQHGMDAQAAALEANQRMESYLRDTRMDEAVVEMARTEILQQTGMSILKKVMEQNRQSIAGLLDLTA